MPVDRTAARGEAARRVWHLRATNFVGGPEKQILEHLARLPGSGWRPAVVVFGGDRGASALAARAEAVGVEVVRLEGRGSFDPRQVLSLRRQLTRASVDLLVTHGYRADLVGAAARCCGGPPQIVFVRGFTSENRHVRLFERLQRIVVRRAAAVACVSRATAAAIVADGVAAERVATVHNAVGVAEATPAPDPDSPPVVVAAGRLSPEKGHALLLEAFAGLAQDQARLVVYGEGVLRGELERRAKALGIAERVSFAGFVRDLPERIGSATLLVNPSTTEGLPNVVLEALSVGTPVVATAVGGVPELLGDVGCGRLVASGDVDALRDAIDGVLRDLPLARAEATVGRDRVRASYSFESQAGHLVRLYDAVALRRSPADTAGRAADNGAGAT